MPAKKQKPTLLVLNGSPRGRRGNCQVLIKEAKKILAAETNVIVVHLSEEKSFLKVRRHLKNSQGVIFVTGTYWDSWGSPLQKFLEEMTDLEGSPSLLGKPAAVFVLMHSVGGKGVLSRLQGVLSTLGFLIPPMSGMVYSLVSELALKDSHSKKTDDLWCLDDMPRVLMNLLLGLNLKISWQTWPVDRVNFRETWLKIKK